MCPLSFWYLLMDVVIYLLRSSWCHWTIMILEYFLIIMIRIIRVQLLKRWSWDWLWDQNSLLFVIINTIDLFCLKCLILLYSLLIKLFLLLYIHLLITLLVYWRLWILFYDLLLETLIIKGIIIDEVCPSLSQYSPLLIFYGGLYII